LPDFLGSGLGDRFECGSIGLHRLRCDGGHFGTTVEKPEALGFVCLRCFLLRCSSRDCSRGSGALRAVFVVWTGAARAETRANKLRGHAR
jgi:hypothetical protein